MFTILWKIGPDHEEIFSTASVSKIPAAEKQSDDFDCHGRPHLAFQALTPIEDDGAGLRLVRTVIDSGEIFVMNAEGKTVAMYRFEAESRARIAA
jgi:hypothetical protein